MEIRIKIRDGQEHLLDDVFEHIKQQVAEREENPVQWASSTNNNGFHDDVMMTIDFYPHWRGTWPEKPEEEVENEKCEV